MQIEFILVMAFLAVMALAAFIGFFRILRFKRMIVDTPFSKISSAAQGFVKIKGIIQSLDDKEVLISPLTQKSCCWYDYSIEQLGKQKNDSDVLIEKKTSNHLFRIIDDTGECVVYPDEAEVLTYYKGSWNTRGFDPKLISAEPALMLRLKDQLKNNYNYCFRENRLNIGRETIILGYLQNYSTERNPIQENSTNNKRISIETQKLSFEDNHIAIQQWEKLKNSKENINFISGFNLEGRPYIITDLNLYSYAEDCRKNMWLCALAFFACGIIMALAITKRMV